MSKKNYKETYFQHDRYARRDPKIKEMLTFFRKDSDTKAQAAVCLFWWIVEDMHTDDYPVDKLEMFADDYRCDINFLKSILEDFQLFRIENGCYVSDRVLRNLKEQQEKSEKARSKINKRWNKNGAKQHHEMTEEDAEFVNQVISKFNKLFNRTQIVSKENRLKINDITKDNNLTIDLWTKVFKNAKRGWDIDDKQNVKPMLLTILDKWDSFASGDYHLAPDREAEKKAKEEKEKAEKIKKAQEEKEIEEERQKAQAIFDAICDKESAINYINNILKLPDMAIRVSKVVKEFGKKYDFTPEDVISAKGNK